MIMMMMILGNYPVAEVEARSRRGSFAAAVEGIAGLARGSLSLVGSVDERASWDYCQAVVVVAVAVVAAADQLVEESAEHRATMTAAAVMEFLGDRPKKA